MSKEFRQTTLDNGLMIVGEVNPAAHTAAAGFFVKTGARDEPVELMGVSHFLEHMMFKGTAQRTAEQVNIDFDRIGAHYNASTSQETTCYWAHVLPTFIDDALELLADILRPSLQREDFEMERKVILEEIGMYADRPFWVAYERGMEAFLADHPLGHRVLGTNQTISALQRDQMAAYFDRRYSPDNMVVSFSGKIDFDHCAQRIAELCGHWQRTGATRDYQSPQPQSTEQALQEERVTRHYTLMLSPGPSKQDPHRYAAEVLGMMLGDTDGSRLYWQLIDPGLADEAELVFFPFDQFGVFLAFASCAAQRAGQVDGILSQVMNTAADQLSDAEVERARNKIAMDLTLQNERPAGRMMSVGSTWLYNGEYLPLEEELRRIESVDVEAVRQLLEQFSFTPRTTIRIDPQE
jgi:predicted Zn-dependent peptidase